MATTSQEKKRIKSMGFDIYQDCHYCDATDIDDNKYSFPNFNENGPLFLNLKNVLDQCESIEILSFLMTGLTREMYNILILANVRIGTICVVTKQVGLLESEFVALCQRFKGIVFKCDQGNPAIWDDKVLTKVLPYTLFDSTLSFRPEVKESAKLITDKTLRCLIGKNEVQKRFFIKNIYNSFTVKEIVMQLEVIHDRKIMDLHWHLGILQADQLADANRYFNSNDGERRYKYNITVKTEPRGMTYEIVSQHPEIGDDGESKLVDYARVEFWLILKP